MKMEGAVVTPSSLPRLSRLRLSMIARPWISGVATRAALYVGFAPAMSVSPLL